MPNPLISRALPKKGGLAPSDSPASQTNPRSREVPVPLFWAKPVSRLVLICLTLCLTGCAGTGLFHFSNDFPKPSLKNPVTRIVGLWQTAEGVAVNDASRGFSGQILFFANDEKLPVQVDGEVMIYVFDDQGSQEEQIKPIHQWRYPAESWNALLGKGPLGATYNVFIPYTRPGFHQADCTLRVRYTPKQGPTIYSEMVHIVLPGAKKKAKSPAEADGTASLTAAASSAGLPSELPGRQPPHVHGVTEPIPVAASHEPSRPRAAELTDEDRQRLMEAAKARLEAEKRHKVELAGYEEPAGRQANGAETGWRRRRPNVLLEEADGGNPFDSEESDSAPLRKQSSKRHILDDENEDAESEFENPAVRPAEDGVE